MPSGPIPSDVSRPFYGNPWRSDTRPAAKALWKWHLAWKQAAEQAQEENVQASFRQAADRVANGEVVEMVPPDVQEAAYAACQAHRISLDLLADQATAAAYFAGPIRFADREAFQAFIAQWAMPLGEALVRLAGARGSWQIGQAREAARGFFLTGCLAELPYDLEKDRLFIPQSDLDGADVSLDQLRAGEIDGAMRKLLWKQVVRARDAFAQGQPLVHELPRRYARALKRQLLGGLEWLNEIERRGYDVWTSPINLSPFRKAQVRFQAQFGRATFRKR